eukprot:3813664-Pyramimonas_sp.AAC.1
MSKDAGVRFNSAWKTLSNAFLFKALSSRPWRLVIDRQHLNDNVDSQCKLTDGYKRHLSGWSSTSPVPNGSDGLKQP